MKRAIAAVGIALAALSSTAALAAAGDAWYGTNRHEDVSRAQIVLPAESTILYEERAISSPVYVASSPVYVQREYPVLVEREYIVSEPRDVWIVSSLDPAYDPLHPEMGQRIGRGLFNRTGPNDFGQ